MGCPWRSAEDTQVHARRCICESWCTHPTLVGACASRACSPALRSLRPSQGPTGSRLLSEQHWRPPSCLPLLLRVGGGTFQKPRVSDDGIAAMANECGRACSGRSQLEQRSSASLAFREPPVKPAARYHLTLQHITFKKAHRDCLPGGPVVKTLGSQRRGLGFNSRLGNQVP